MFGPHRARSCSTSSTSGGRTDLAASSYRRPRPAVTCHRFFASKTPAATLLRVGPIVRRFSYVYRPTAERPQVVAPRPTTRDDVREWIGYLATVVEG
jgi:hypothetical protein